MRGHVGVVSGIDANGNPIIVSGNHNHTVAESVYPRSRIAAYVVPGG
jgi:formylmethanofuran dehydrogenase subunit C